VKIMSMYEAGLDGFLVHRLLAANGIENHVVDATRLRWFAAGDGRRPIGST
jgi:hypothetical protein